MRDMSINLPYWATQKGYRLVGGEGTYDELYLYKDFKPIRVWEYTEQVPNIFEMEGIINACENKEAR